MTVFTIGYEGLNIDRFKSLLMLHDIETVVDVRELPLSRKPGFSKNALKATLNMCGINYVHKVELGCPKPVRNRYREDGNWKGYTEQFLKYLDTQDGPIAELSALANVSSCVLLCFEADFQFCHRSMVADAVSEHCGADVEHISTLRARTASSGCRQMALA